MELLTSAQMRATETAAMTCGAVTGLELMERAGKGVVQAILTEWPDLSVSVQGEAPKAIVLCGPGNNGGDGFVVARILAEVGWAVAVYLYGEAAGLPPDAGINHARWAAMGAVLPLTAGQWERPDFPGQAALVVDALFGTGLTRPVALPLGTLTAAVDVGQTRRFVAVDLPSGLCSDSGRPIGPETQVFRADLTVTFHAMKLGHVLGEGPRFCGKSVIVDIGLPQSGADHVMLTASPTGLEKGQGHKFDHGHALILSGGPGKGGAARMAAHGALRIGAGVVTVGCPPAALLENAVALDAVMVREVADAMAMRDMLQDGRINALCLGPGLGLDPRERALLMTALSHDLTGGLVLDADALTHLASAPDAFAKLHGGCVLTPHAGEFARLFPDLAEALSRQATQGPAWSRVDACRAAAQRAGCVVLLKGPDTVIAAPDGRCRVNAAVYDNAAPWLATAGAGDVLAGFISGLLARGVPPFEAAQAAVWLHVACARAFGPGLIAEDLPAQLPRVFRDLTLVT